MLSRARRLAAREGFANLMFLRGTVFRLPFIDAAFPLINCCGALHLFDRPEAALAEIGRVLCRGGRLAIQTALRPERTSLLFRALERFIRFGSFEEGELLEMLRRQRLEVLESERHRVSCTLLARKAA
jgi:ubiquinone/menaquinone biosynthesis C-methylase UbiE